MKAVWPYSWFWGLRARCTLCGNGVSMCPGFGEVAQELGVEVAAGQDEDARVA
jgi:hypothetical protein